MRPWSTARAPERDVDWPTEAMALSTNTAEDAPHLRLEPLSYELYRVPG